MAAPNSAHTRPSQMASSAPATQPSMACGPPIASTMSGMVMKGPTPIISVMFSAIALPRVTPRMRRVSSFWGGGICGAMDGSGFGIIAAQPRYTSPFVYGAPASPGWISGAGGRNNPVHAQVFHHLPVFVAAVDHRISGRIDATDGRVPELHQVKHVFSS